VSKLRKAVSKASDQLGQDVKPPTSKERRLALQERRKRRVRVAGEADKLGSHLPANENAGEAVTEEPAAIAAARKRLRAMVAAATTDAPRPSVGIVLAIVNQETGNHTAANALIDEYELERLYGIKKFCPNG